MIASLQLIAAGLRFWDKPEHAQGVLAFSFEGDARGTVVALVGLALFRCWKHKFVEIEVVDVSVNAVLAEGARGFDRVFAGVIPHQHAISAGAVGLGRCSKRGNSKCCGGECGADHWLVPKHLMVFPLSRLVSFTPRPFV